MPQQISPFIDVKYGWDYGESNWNEGVDENFLKFSFLFDNNVDAVVSSLPAPATGKSYFLTTDNRFYFVVKGTYVSSPVPKNFQFNIKDTGQIYQFTGSSVQLIESSVNLDTRLDAAETTISSLGTAAFQPASNFATTTALTNASTAATNYTNSQIATVNSQITVVDSTATNQTIPNTFAQIMLKDRVNAVWFGLRSTATPSAQSAALTSAAAYAKANKKRLYIPGDTYTFSSGVKVQVPIEMDGGILDFSQATDLTASGGNGLQVAGDGLTALPALSADVAKWSTSIVLTTATTLLPGDMICLHNPANNSWSAARTYYTAGEFATVVKAVGTTVYLSAPLYDPYAAATTNIYKMNTIKGSWDFNGTDIIGPNISSFPNGIGVEFYGLGRSQIYGLTARNANLANFQVRQCYGLDIVGSNALLLDNTLNGNQYGLAIINSQSVHTTGGLWESQRHGITIGGQAEAGSIVNRDIRTVGASISTRGDTQAADFHGNTEFSTYDGCKIIGGGSVGGNKNSYRNCDITSNSLGYLLFGSELKGCDWDFSNIRGEMTAVPGSGFGVVHLVTNATTVLGGTFKVNDFTMTGVDAASRFPFQFLDSGSTAANRNITMDNVHINSPTSAQFIRVTATGTVWNSVNLGLVTTNGNATPSVTATTKNRVTVAAFT